MANKIAIENEFVSAQMVEATEFPHLAMKYNVRGVPRTMVAENFPIEGALPEEAFVRKVLEAYNQLK